MRAREGANGYVEAIGQEAFAGGSEMDSEAFAAGQVLLDANKQFAGAAGG